MKESKKKTVKKQPAKAIKKETQRKGTSSPKRRMEEKEPKKVFVTGTTEVLDFNLDEELEKLEAAVPRQRVREDVEAAVPEVKAEHVRAEAFQEDAEAAAVPEAETGPVRAEALQETEETAVPEMEAEFMPAEMPAQEGEPAHEKLPAEGELVPEKGPEKEPQAAAAEAREEPQNLSKSAADSWQEQMPAGPVTLGQDTMELLGIEEVLPLKEFEAERRESQRASKAAVTKQKSGGRSAAQGKRTSRPGKKRRRGAFADFSIMDAIIGITGVAVLFVAIVAIGLYSNASSLKQHVAAMAEVGAKMESIGYAGTDILTAVADSRIAAQEAAELMESEDGDDPYSYEEKELVSSVSVALKLTSVQKDLKIKFTNKNSGKLIGNQPFRVKIEGPESLEKTDDDEDGIIYISSMKSGEYTVTILAPDEVDGSKAAGTKGIVTVKDQIEYKKIDVADEVKSESEINAAKEDTKVATQVESVQTDTVEWVESTKTAIGTGGAVSWTEVKKSDIPDPSATAVLDKVWAADGQSGAYIKQSAFEMTQNAAWLTDTAVKRLTAGVYFTEEQTGGTDDNAETEHSASLLTESQPSTEAPSEQPSTEESTEQPSTEAPSEQPSTEAPSEQPSTEAPKPEFKVTAVQIAGYRDCTVGETLTLTGQVTTEGEGSLSAGDYQWSGASGNGAEATFTAQTAGAAAVTLTVKGISASVTINVKEKAATKVTSIKIPDSISIVAGGKGSLSLEVQPSDAKDKSVTWSVAEGGDYVSVDGSGNVTGKKAGTAKVIATANDGSGVKSNTCNVTVTSGIGISMDAPGSIRVGEEKTLKCTASGDYSSSSIEWTISDSSIASIDKTSGKVKGLKTGKATVTVSVKSSDGKESARATGELTVSAAGVDSITLDPSGITLKVGEKATLKATVSTTGNKAVTWKSNDETMVKIVSSTDTTCEIEALKAGTIRVSATSRENSEKTVYCEVSVQPKNPSALLKDASGNQLYVKENGDYREATVADYYKFDVFYRKSDTTKYLYTGWQNIDGKRYYFDKNGNPVTGEQTIQGIKYSFNSDGSLKVSGSMGIDVSKHNGSIDWNSVKNAGVNFVIIRCGYRGSATGVLVEDPKFKTNIQGAIAAGLKVGIYFFSQATTEVEAVEEASMTVSLIRKYNITYPVYMDVEAANGRADGLSASARTAVIRAFCETVRNSGYTAGVYANKNWLSEKMNVGSLGNYKIWLAQYAATPTYGGRYEMWQYSSTGRISGIPELVDLNISYMSY